MDLADALGIRSIAFPALGTGVGGFPFRPTADAMVRTLAAHLGGDTSVEQVTLALFPRPGVTDADLASFYEHAAGLASLWGQSKRLGASLDDFLARAESSGTHDLAVQLRSVDSELRAAQATLATTPPDVVEIVTRGDQSGLGEIGDHAIHLSRDSLRSDAGMRPDTRAAALKVELEALRAKGNFQYLKMSKLQTERAMYEAGAGRAELDVSIERLRHDILATDADIENAQHRIACLMPIAG